MHCDTLARRGMIATETLVSGGAATRSRVSDSDLLPEGFGLHDLLDPYGLCAGHIAAGALARSNTA